MKDNESSSQPLAHETVQSHHTLISVMFGVALGFWVNTLHAYEFKNLNVPLGITILLTFAVIICVYWWYIHLCSHYPSHTLVQYSIDFMIVIGLCIMSMACGEKTQFKWTISWGFLAVLASLKVWLCPGEVAQLLDKRLVWAPSTM